MNSIHFSLLISTTILTWSIAREKIVSGPKHFLELPVAFRLSAPHRSNFLFLFARSLPPIGNGSIKSLGFLGGFCVSQFILLPNFEALNSIVMSSCTSRLLFASSRFLCVIKLWKFSPLKTRLRVFSKESVNARKRTAQT